MKKFNMLGSGKNLDYRRISELVVGKKYLLAELKRTTTKYGEQAVAVLYDGESERDAEGKMNETFNVYLPSRFEKSLHEEDMEELNALPKKWLIYDGTKTGTGGDAFTSYLVRIVV